MVVDGGSGDRGEHVVDGKGRVRVLTRRRTVHFALAVNETTAFAVRTSSQLPICLADFGLVTGMSGNLS